MAVRHAVLPFGRALKLRRDKQGLTQGALAERMADLMEEAVDQTTVSKWEMRGLALRDHAKLVALANVLMTTVDDLIAGRVPAEWVGVEEPRTLDVQDELSELIAQLAPSVPPTQARLALELMDLMTDEERTYWLGVFSRVLGGKAERVDSRRSPYTTRDGEGELSQRA